MNYVQTHSFKVGDEVCYRAAFLRSVGWYTSVPRSGRVVSVDGPLGFPVVDWADGDPRAVHPSNLILRANLHLEAR